MLSEEIKDLTRLLKLGYEERHLQKQTKKPISPEKDNINKSNVKPQKQEIKEVKPIKFPKKEYKFFTSRPPDYLTKKKSDNKKYKKSLNTSNVSGSKENSKRLNSKSNIEYDSNEEASMEMSQSDIDAKMSILI